MTNAQREIHRERRIIEYAERTGIAAEDTEACVMGETLDGATFEGCDDILVISMCGVGFELALLLPGLMWLRQRRRSN